MDYDERQPSGDNDGESFGCIVLAIVALIVLVVFRMC